MKLNLGEEGEAVEVNSRKEALWREFEKHNGIGALVAYVFLFSILLAYPLVLGGRVSQWGAYGMLVLCFSLLLMLLHRKPNSVIALVRGLHKS